MLLLLSLSSLLYMRVIISYHYHNYRNTLLLVLSLRDRYYNTIIIINYN